CFATTLRKNSFAPVLSDTHSPALGKSAINASKGRTGSGLMMISGRSFSITWRTARAAFFGGEVPNTTRAPLPSPCLPSAANARLNKTRHDRRSAYARSPVSGAQRRRESNQARFGCSVRLLKRRPGLSGQRRNIHNVPAFAHQHFRQQHPRQYHRCFEIDR